MIAAVVGLPIAYFLGYRQTRFERLYEQRALVIAELSRLLWRFQMTALLGTNPDQPPQVRAERIAENQQAMTDLNYYYFANALWLDAETNQRIESFLMDMTNALRRHQGDLDEQGYPGSHVSIEEARRIFYMVPTVREELAARFRAILYPPPWYDAPLRFLEWLQATAKQDRH